MRKSDPFIVSTWSGFVFGILEGILLNISRAYPVILAPYKTSSQVLWIAPVVDIALFTLAAAGIAVLLWIFRKWIREIRPDILYGLFSFFGIFVVLNALKVIHPASAAVLALGLAVIASRGVKRIALTLTGILRRKILWVPAILLLLGVSVAGYERMVEAARYQNLPNAASAQTNVLVIVMDTVRYDRFNRPEGESLTPNIDRITSGGIQYTNAWPTTSWSLPSHASIVTGLYPDEHCADWPQLGLNRARPTLGEFFVNEGYVTGAFSGNSAWVTPEYLGRGFLRFEVYTIEDQLRRTSLGRIVNKFLEILGYHSAGLGKKAPEVNKEFINFLEDYPDQPFFVLINYMDANQAFHKKQLGRPFWVDAPAVDEVVRAYDESLSVLDAQIGDLFSELEARGILENTLVILTSDHGESFGEGALHDHNPEGHGTSLYVEQMRVPLFVLLPGQDNQAEKVEQLVSLAQIPATVVYYLGYPHSPFSATPLPMDHGQIHTAIQALSGSELGVWATLNYNENHLRSLVWGEWQYIEHLQSPGTEELFNLVSDPYAQQNVAMENPRVGKAQAALANTMGEPCAQPGK